MNTIVLHALLAVAACSPEWPDEDARQSEASGGDEEPRISELAQVGASEAQVEQASDASAVTFGGCAVKTPYCRRLNSCVTRAQAQSVVNNYRASKVHPWGELA